MPAASTTRRKVSSPQRPRAWFELSTRRNCSVSFDERLALLGQRFQVLLHFAQRRGLRALGLLQPLAGRS